MGHAARDLDGVGPHRGRGGQLARPAAVEHEVAHVVAGDEHGVEHAGDRGERGAGRDHGGVDPHLERAVGGLGDGQELDAIAELGRVHHVLLADPGDALGVDVLQVDPGAEGEGGQDLELVGRVEPLDVQRGVRLRVAVGLRLLQDLREVASLVGHLGEDVVAGAVDDAEGGAHAVGDQAVLHRADQRDAARHRGLEPQHDPVAPRLLEQLGPVVGEQGLVGGHHVLARLQGAQDEGARGLEPADQLDHDLHRGIVDGLGRVGGQRQAREVDPFAGSGEVGVGHAAQRERAARALGQLGAVALEDPGHPAPDGAEPQEGDLDLVHPFIQGAAPGLIRAAPGRPATGCR